MPRGSLFFVKMRIYSNIFIHIPGFTKSDLEFISNSTTYTHKRDKKDHKLVHPKEDIKTDSIVKEELKQFFNRHPEGCLLNFG